MSFIINPYLFVPAGGGQLLNEQFEAPGATGWTSTTTTPNVAWTSQYNTSPAPLVGSYSGRIDGTTQQVNAQKTFTASGNVYCRFRVNHSRGTGGNGTLATLRNSAGTVLATFGIVNTSSTSRAIPAGGSTVNAATAPTLGTTYYCWFEYEKGTGANAIVRVGLSTSPTRPTWPASGASGFLAVSVNGTSTSNADRIMFGTNTSVTNYSVILDDIQIQSTPFA